MKKSRRKFPGAFKVKVIPRPSGNKATKKAPGGNKGCLLLNC